MWVGRLSRLQLDSLWVMGLSNDFRRGGFADVARVIIGCAIFFPLIGKPFSSFAGTSSLPGLGSIPYTSVWTNGSTGGNGFGVWQLSPTNSASGFFYVNSSTNNNNTGGVAWGISATNGVLANATRPFPGALTTSQTLQIDMDNGNIATGGSV